MRQREYLALSQNVIPIDGKLMSVLKVKCLNQIVRIFEVELADMNGNSFGLSKKEVLMHQNDLVVFKFEFSPTANAHWIIRYTPENDRENDTAMMMESKLIITPSTNNIVKIWLQPLSKELNQSIFLVYALKSEGAEEIIYELDYDAEDWLIQGKTGGLLQDEELLLLCPLRQNGLILPKISCKGKNDVQTIFECPSNAQIVKLDR